MEDITINKVSELEDVTLDTFVEESENPDLNLLESKLYDKDNNVSVEKKTIEEDYDGLEVYYKKQLFIIDKDFSITISEDVNNVIVTASVLDTKISSLKIKADIEGIDLSKIKEIYYSCDNGSTWKASGNETEFTYGGLKPNTTYNIKVKVSINNKSCKLSNGIQASTKSIESVLASIPADFFIINETGNTITGINSTYKNNNKIVYDGFDGELVIPNRWNNIDIVKVAKDNSSPINNIDNLKCLFIEEGITTLDKLAFQYCTSLTEVILPTSLESIDITNIYSSFYNCNNIKNVTIPQYIINGTNKMSNVFKQAYTTIEEVNYNNNITYIGVEAFKGCIAIKSINVPETVTTINESAFYGCTGLTSVTIEENVETIGKNAFYNCSELTDLIIRSGVKTIGYSAFGNCTKLKNLVLEEGIMTLDKLAFQNCTALTEVILPKTIVSIDISNIYSSFYNCDNIKNVTIPQHIINGTNNFSNVFKQSYTKIEEVYFNDDISYIGKDAFKGCIAIKSINLPETVTTIDEGAFSNCTGLTSVTIEENVETIGKNAFYNCSELTDLIIRSGVKTIGYSAFGNCTKLKNLVLEEGIMTLDKLAFQNCTALTEVILPSTVTSLDSSNIYSTFYKSTNITKITVKKAQGTLSGAPWGATNATVIWEP